MAFRFGLIGHYCTTHGADRLIRLLLCWCPNGISAPSLAIHSIAGLRIAVKRPQDAMAARVVHVHNNSTTDHQALPVHRAARGDVRINPAGYADDPRTREAAAESRNKSPRGCCRRHGPVQRGGSGSTCPARRKPAFLQFYCSAKIRLVRTRHAGDFHDVPALAPQVIILEEPRCAPHLRLLPSRQIPFRPI